MVSMMKIIYLYWTSTGKLKLISYKLYGSFFHKLSQHTRPIIFSTSASRLLCLQNRLQFDKRVQNELLFKRYLQTRFVGMGRVRRVALRTRATTSRHTNTSV